MKIVKRIKKWGNSCVIALNNEDMKFFGLKENDWVDIGDIVKIENENRKNS